MKPPVVKTYTSYRYAYLLSKDYSALIKRELANMVFDYKTYYIIIKVFDNGYISKILFKYKTLSEEQMRDFTLVDEHELL